MENNHEESLLQMDLDHDGGHILSETVRWSRFLSIVGIVGLSICALALVLAGSALTAAFSKFAPDLAGLESLGGVVVIVAGLGVLAIFGFVIYMLYRFSVLTRRGIERQNQADFTEGMKCLKIYFIISGVFAIMSLLGNLFSLTKLFHL